VIRRAAALILLATVARAEPEAPPAEMKPEAKAHYDRGIELYTAGHYDEAIVELEAGRALDPRPEFTYSLGQSERKRGNCKVAIEHFQAYLAITTSLKQAGAVHILIDRCVQEQIDNGNKHFRDGDLPLAAIAFEGALSQPQLLTRPQLLDAWEHLGIAWFRLGKLPDAERSFQELLKLDRDRLLDPALGKPLLDFFATVKNPPKRETVTVRVARTTTVYGAARLHLGATLFADLVPLADMGTRMGGGEIAASFSPIAWLDLGASAVIGQNVGVRVAATTHGSRLNGHRPGWLAQARFVLHPLPGGIALGGGVMLGGTLEAGPGRILAGAIAEAYSAPNGFYPYALLLSAGYELDLLKPSRQVVVQ
jgi:tetratricopeptide (TPR) repeat protein